MIWLNLFCNLMNSDHLCLLYSCLHVVNLSWNSLPLSFGASYGKHEPKEAMLADPRHNFV